MDVLPSDGFNRGIRANRHKDRGVDDAVRGREGACSGLPLCGVQGEGKGIVDVGFSENRQGIGGEGFRHGKRLSF